MRSFILLSLIPLLSTVTAAPQVVPVIGGLLGDAGLTPITGALGEVLNSIPILYAAAPSFLMTQDPSPQCAAVNHGTLLCCNSEFNGDMPLVVELAQLAGNFRLNPNSINGLYCQKNFEHCGNGVKLCCQSDAVVNPPVINDVLSVALWCQDAPEQDSSCV